MVKPKAEDQGTTKYTASWLTVAFLLPLISQYYYPLLFAMVFAVLLRHWAMKVLGEYFSRVLRIKEDQKLIRAGPYRLVRNPGYLASLILLSSFSLLVSTSIWILVVILILFAIIYYWRISAEEAMLEKTFGEEWRKYRKETYCLIPYVY
jgi:protein-S-isoprenylcysteine O-methyltransferase Ste14